MSVWQQLLLVVLFEMKKFDRGDYSSFGAKKASSMCSMAMSPSLFLLHKSRRSALLGQVRTAECSRLLLEQYV